MTKRRCNDEIFKPYKIGTLESISEGEPVLGVITAIFLPNWEKYRYRCAKTPEIEKIRVVKSLYWEIGVYYFFAPKFFKIDN